MYYHYHHHQDHHLNYLINFFDYHFDLIPFIAAIVSMINSVAHHYWCYIIYIGYKYTFLAWVSAPTSSLPLQTSGVRCHGNIPTAVASFLQKGSWEILQFLAINNGGQVPASRLSLFAFGINLVFSSRFWRNAGTEGTRGGCMSSLDLEIEGMREKGIGERRCT